VSELCQTAGGSLGQSQPRVVGQPKPQPRVCDFCAASVISLETLSDRRANAELEVARYRLAVATTSAARETLAAEVETKEAAYSEAVGERNTGVAGVDAAEAVQMGAGAVVAALPWIGDNQRDLPVALDVIGWVLLGTLALLLYRWLEQRAAARALGPVTVEGKEETDVARFRTYVLRNIPDPGAVPGASALQPVTDLLAATQLPTVIGKVVSAIAAVLGQKHGYTVQFQVFGAEKDQPSTKAPVAQPDAGSMLTEIAVRVNKARNGELVNQRVVQHSTKDEALRKAAYWAAAVVLERSDRVPRWAQWSSETSDSLAVFFSEEDLRKRNLEQLKEAVSRAPTSGVLCLQLSNAYALEEQHLNAFEFALRAATLHPNFVAACYRLAMSASLVASDLGLNWWNQSLEQRARVLSAVERHQPSGAEALRKVLDAAEVKKAREEGRDVGPLGPEAELCSFALKELDHTEKLLRIRLMLVNSLRRSERAYWLTLLRPHRRGLTWRMQFRRAVASGRPAVRQRAQLPMAINEVEKWQNDPRTFWQVAYNLACWEAIRHGQGFGDAEAAVRRLEIAIERPNSHQLTRSWLEKDPDLNSIRRNDRFRQFVESVHDDRRADARDA
jgi:hypothetical protein